MTGAPAKGRGALEVILFEETRFRGSLMFTSAEVTVGSDPGVMIRLDDPTLSPCHAVLRFDGDRCVIENFDALQGTLVNGGSIERHDVTATDEIQIGRFRLRITVHRADATPAPVSLRPPARPLLPTRAPDAPSAKVFPLPVPPAPPPVPRASPPPPSPTPARTEARVPSPSPPAPAPASVKLPVPPATAPKPTVAPSAPAVSTANAAPALKPEPIAPPVAEPAAPVAKKRPSLSSVPVETTAKASRTSTQPITSRPAKAGVVAPTPARAKPVSSAQHTVMPSGGLARVSDDDDDDAPFEPTFSLFDKLRESGTAAHQASAVEVVRFRQGCILKLRHLRRGEKLRLHGLRKPLGRCSGAGGFLFTRDALPEGIAISRGGDPIDEASWRQNADQRGHIALEPATQVLFPLPSGEGVLVHLVPAAAPLPKSGWRPKLDKLLLRLGATSIVVHLIVFLVIGLSSLVRRDYIADNKEGRFARIALKEIELEPPAPPPKKEKEKKKAKAEPSQVATAEPMPKSVPRIPRMRTPSQPQTQSSATTQKLLSALGGVASGPKAMSATAMSNLAAAGPVKGGGFKVSGAIGSLPGDSLRLAAAGSGIGRIDTKSASDVGKNLGKVLGRGSTGQVRAQVTSKPNTMKVEGHLDRGEIQKVINAHIHELQGCYERQLVMSPNLSGKVTFEWVIGTNGAVTTVRIKASTLSSNEATSCMQAAVHRWQFPAPSGGQVTVIYPIALANSGT
jgi:hypothetical protein